MADTDPDEDRKHLEDLDESAGCVEIWEELSERRSKAEPTGN